MQFVQTDECRRMEQLLQSLSTKHVFVKFVKCKAGDALKNYPDSQCPTLLVYRGGAVLKQFIKFDSFGGAKASVDGTCLATHVSSLSSVVLLRLILRAGLAMYASSRRFRAVVAASLVAFCCCGRIVLPLCAPSAFLELMLTTSWPPRTCSLLSPGGRLSRYLSCCLLSLTTQTSSGSCPNWASSPRS